MAQADSSKISADRPYAELAGRLAEVTNPHHGMRVARNLLLAGLIASLLPSLGSAQTTIYSDTFTGGATNVNQQSPTVALDNAGAASSAIWKDGANSTMLYQNGTVNTTAGDSVLLPFTPEKGYIYTLTASVTFTGNPGSWVGAGFAENYYYPGAGNSQFNQATVNGYDWAILTESSGNVQWFSGPSTTGPEFNQNAFFTAGTGTHTLVLTLNTTGTKWTMSCEVDGNTAGSTYTYTTNPLITAVGLTQHALTSDSVVKWNSISLTASGTRATNAVSASVSFSGTTVPLGSSFIGLSYEKQNMVNGYMSVSNTSLVNLFNMLGPAVLRIAGATVDTSQWQGTGTLDITTADADTFNGFMGALNSNWKVIYGIGLETNTPANAESEAAYEVSGLGSKLLGFEIGNEPEFYPGETYSSFLTSWTAEKAAMTTGVAGWDHGSGTGGWILDGADAGQGQLSAYTDPFAVSEAGYASLLSQHYYVASTGKMQDILVAPNSTLTNLASNIATNASGRQVLGSRITETGSLAEGGLLGVSNALGAAFWAVDFMFTAAEEGVKGVNFHGGGKSPYSPINGVTTVTSVGPEFYAAKMFSLIPTGGSMIPATVTLNPTGENFSVYGVKASSGKITAVLNNKEVNDTVSVTLNLGSGVTHVNLYSLTAPNLFASTGLTLGGQPITTSGTWSGGVQQTFTVTAGALTVNVPPATVYLLIPQ
jgi:hypothetical protein